MSNSVTTVNKKYRMYFLVFTLLMVATLFIKPEWFWVWLPFVCTYFVLMLDWL
jgi:hypothetical protein